MKMVSDETETNFHLTKVLAIKSFQFSTYKGSNKKDLLIFKVKLYKHFLKLYKVMKDSTFIQRERLFKGQPQLKKSLKFQLLAKISWSPSPPLRKRALPTKTLVFLTISPESQTSPILSTQEAPECVADD